MVVALAATALGPAHATAQVDGRPNIVFVMTDDQTRDSLRVMSKLQAGAVAQGTQFTRSVAIYPLCCPSRATYLTGQYSHNHGVIHNAGPFGGYTRLDNTNTLPVWLQNAGYRTMNVGRYLNGYGTQNPDRTEIPPGWSDWYATVDPNHVQLHALADERERPPAREAWTRPPRRVPDRLSRPPRHSS